MSDQYPQYQFCLLCNEEIFWADEKASGAWTDEQGRRRQAHRECALRNVVGGIGHLKDHYLWCTKCGDPDGGLTYRESAKAVDAWVREKGFPSD